MYNKLLNIMAGKGKSKQKGDKEREKEKGKGGDNFMDLLDE